MPVVSTAKMNARQFLMLGEDPPGIRLELVDGEVAVSPCPRPKHSYASITLSSKLLTHINKKRLGLLLGDTDTIFGEYDVRRPDMVYFVANRMHLVHPDEAIDGPPDLCVEIISPSSNKIDREDKFKQYAKGRVPYYWILDPTARRFDAFKLKGHKYVPIGSGRGDDIVAFAPFSDLKIPLRDLWFPPLAKQSSKD